MFRAALLFVAIFALIGCATTPPSTPHPQPDPVVTPSEPVKPPAVNGTSPIDSPEQVSNVQTPDQRREAFSRYPGWKSADMRPAARAFAKSCLVWAKKNASGYFNSSRPDLGRVSDWSEGCRDVSKAARSEKAARAFFETYFFPQSIRSDSASTGLITGYYQPEIRVSRKRDKIYSEPILALPKTDGPRRLPRSQITEDMADVIAYGRPVEVFFMQVQGSGILKFKNGDLIRASYAGNNGYPYTSIGGVLVRAGYMTKEQASKQAIEEWMEASGPKAARMLMNENKRYIFFKPEQLVPNDGPTGAMNVPLTAMGSLAVDPAFHTYGVPIWLNVKLPQEGGDYRGLDSGLLVIAQDTGKAIRGLLRGDLYFGSGDEAGERAGVMKHPGTWAVLLPVGLLDGSPVS